MYLLAMYIYTKLNQSATKLLEQQLLTNLRKARIGAPKSCKNTYLLCENVNMYSVSSLQAIRFIDYIPGVILATNDVTRSIRRNGVRQ